MLSLTVLDSNNEAECVLVHYYGKPFLAFTHLIQISLFKIEISLFIIEISVFQGKCRYLYLKYRYLPLMCNTDG